MYLAYISGEEIQDDYSKMFNITFNEYINPSTENIVAAIAQAITGRVYSIEIGGKSEELTPGQKAVKFLRSRNPNGYK